MSLEVITLGENGITESDVLVHDETNPVLAYMLSRMPFPQYPVALGVLYSVARPTYDGAIWQQQQAAEKKLGKGDLQKLLSGGNTWQV